MPARLRPIVRVALVIMCLSAALWPARADRQAPRATTFAGLIERLSERGGDFGGDNLISNEQSYLQVLPALVTAGTTGGVYLGVGPDQNYTYIGQIKPVAAYLIDIRRDNMLLHLLFKALFSLSSTRVEYLSLLAARPSPANLESWRGADVERVVAHIDAARPLPDSPRLALQARVETVIAGFGVPLSASDKATVDGFHREFMQAGLSLVFRARGLPARDYYPSFRDLLLESDPLGRRLSFLADESAFHYVKSLHARDLIVPVVGDVAGTRAMRAIATHIAGKGEAVSSFYISNVEQYLFQQGRFGAFVENVKLFPLTAQATMIRSVFPSGFGRLPPSQPNHYSTSLTQPLAVMLADAGAGRYRRYSDLVLASVR